MKFTRAFPYHMETKRAFVHVLSNSDLIMLIVQHLDPKHHARMLTVSKAMLCDGSKQCLRDNVWLNYRRALSSCRARTLIHHSVVNLNMDLPRPKTIPTLATLMDALEDAAEIQGPSHVSTQRDLYLYMSRCAHRFPKLTVLRARIDTNCEDDVPWAKQSLAILEDAVSRGVWPSLKHVHLGRVSMSLASELVRTCRRHDVTTSRVENNHIFF